MKIRPIPITIVYPCTGFCCCCRCRSPFSNTFSKTAWPIKAKFYVEPPWEGGTKVCINGPGHMTKMAAMRIYMVKTFKSLLLQNGKSYDLETWYAASGTRALQSLYKWWQWVDLDLFYDKVKFGNLCFSIGKIENSGFFRNYCSL